MSGVLGKIIGTMDLINHEVIYFIDEEENRFSACPDCNQKDLESTLRCLVPNLEAFSRDINFHSVAYRQVEILVGHLFGRIVPEVGFDTYEGRITETIECMNQSYAITIGCNNNERDTDLNAAYANRHSLRNYQREYIESYVARRECYCKDRTLIPQYRNCRGEIIWSFR